MFGDIDLRREFGRGPLCRGSLRGRLFGLKGVVTLIDPGHKRAFFN